METRAKKRDSLSPLLLVIYMERIICGSTLRSPKVKVGNWKCIPLYTSICQSWSHNYRNQRSLAGSVERIQGIQRIKRKL